MNLHGIITLLFSGNFDPDRHSPHHLKNFYLLPKRMSLDEEALWELLLDVSASHRSLHGMPPANAEHLYITEAQHLEGKNFFHRTLYILE